MGDANLGDIVRDKERKDWKEFMEDETVEESSKSKKAKADDAPVNSAIWNNMIADHVIPKSKKEYKRMVKALDLLRRRLHSPMSEINPTLK